MAPVLPGGIPLGKDALGRSGTGPVDGRLAPAGEPGVDAGEGAGAEEAPGGGERRGMRALVEERWDIIPGAEPMEALAARVGAGLDHMLSAIGPGGTGAAVLHGGVIGELCRQVTRSRAFAFIHADNCSITRIVEFSIGHRLLRSFNDTAHLATA